MTLPLAQAKTGLLALTRREIRNRCPHGVHHHGAERTGDDPSAAQWPEGLAIRPTPRACSHDRDCRPSSRWITSVSPDQPQSTWSPPQNWEMRSCSRWLRQHRSRRSLRTVPKRSTPAIVLSHVHPGVAILLAAVCGGLITVLVGIARMFRLRRAAKKNLKALTSGR